ncbi:homocysteine methyltransferase [Tissierella creatinini]|nr:homocysteine methyltransferase [Tissierella creatinini]TJX63591.1 homocysteine methyltransferase [Soehngenia saccharolytica]
MIVVLDRLKNEFLFFDGAMGTMLQLAGLKAGDLPESYNIAKPEIILDIHKKYLEAGADFITTNTFGANRLKLKDYDYDVNQIIEKAVALAKESIGGRKDKYVALDIGPIGTLLEPLGTLSFADAYDIFKEQVLAGVKSGADLILIETMSDLYEVKAAILASKENSSLPVFCTMTFQDDTRTFTGTDAITMVNVLEGLGVDALGVNCSRGPGELQSIVNEILKLSSLPVIVQANAGLPKSGRDMVEYDIEPREFSTELEIMANNGVAIFGGCCGTTPEYISTIREKLQAKKPSQPTVEKLTACSSSTQTVILGEEVKIIGERINPTGKKVLKEALKNKDMDYIIREAISQKETGSDILDINVGLPGIDEKEMMTHAIREIQSIISLPLQIDSANVDVIEAALRVYNGKPIINSVNGKKSNMDAILPLVKKYGALVIGLTLDEDGIPKTAQKRLEIASKIIEKAKEYGIPEENILIDPLVLTASAEQENVLETLKAIPLIKSKYKVKIVLGTSNVSFGLPNRKIINTTYLAMALGYGLDAPITDSTNESLMDVIRSFKVLANQDKDCVDFLKNYSNTSAKSEPVKASDLDLKDIIMKGLKDEAGKKTEELLSTLESLELVNQHIIPALDIVGERYEKKEIFLPQLIRSAETAKKSFEVIKEKTLLEGSEKENHGKILLATVQGDIHDLGKNIVKLILENYGYEIIDLGKDVPIETVVAKVKAENVPLVGLSALMTTTVSTMEDTIKSLKIQCPHVKIMVGGAVLTSEYAHLIGADYYAKDAREGVDIAKLVCDILPPL